MGIQTLSKVDLRDNRNAVIVSTSIGLALLVTLKPGIVSFHVDNLVRGGYLLRTRDPGDRRRCRLVCTDKAAPIIARGQALQEQFAAQMSAGLAPEALETFQHCLTAFAQNLDRMANREES